jgi:hypothetical protein
MQREWRLEKTNKETKKKGKKTVPMEQKNQVMKEEEKKEFKWGRMK